MEPGALMIVRTAMRAQGEEDMQWKKPPETGRKKHQGYECDRHGRPDRLPPMEGGCTDQHAVLACCRGGYVHPEMRGIDKAGLPTAHKWGVRCVLGSQDNSPRRVQHLIGQCAGADLWQPATGPRGFLRRGGYKIRRRTGLNPGHWPSRGMPSLF